MSILYINHYAGSIQHGMEFRPFYISREWVRSGEEVLVISSSFSHLRSKNPDSIGEQNVDGVKYFWLWSNRYNGNGAMRLISMLIFVMQLIFMAPYFAIKYKPKAVIASSTYPLDIFPAFLIALFSRAKVIFEIHDLWPMSPQELSNMPSWHPFIMLMKAGEWCSYKFADKVLSILPNTYKYVAKYGVREQNFLHVPNGISVDSEDSYLTIDQDLQSIIDDAKSKGHKVIGYAGALGVANNMHVILDAFKSLKDVKVTLVIVGDGPEKESLAAIAKDHPDIVFYGKVEKRKIMSFLKACDLLIYSLKDSPLYKYGISLNKSYEYMLAAKPIIQIAGITETIIKKSGGGFEINASDDIQEIAQQVSSIVSMPEKELKKIGNAGASYVRSHHDYKVLAKDFLSFILA